MKRSNWVLVGLLILFLTMIPLAGCGVPKSEYEALEAEHATLVEEKNSLTTELDEVQSDLTESQADYEVLKAELERWGTTTLRDALRDELERLSTYEYYHQAGLKPSDFYYTHPGLDLDAQWTSDGITNPAGSPLYIVSKKTWQYPALSIEAILPDLSTPNMCINMGFRTCARLVGSAYFEIVQNDVRMYAASGGDFTYFNVTSHVPADYATVRHRYGLKVNKCNVEGYIDEKLISVILVGLPEPIPQWSDKHPYCLSSLGSSLVGAQLPIGIILHEVGPVRPVPSITLGVKWANFELVCNDGDPLPPRQYALYNENTSTKWNGLATAAAVTSHPVPVWGYGRKTLYFQSNAAGTLKVQVYVGGDWRDYASPTVEANTLVVYSLDSEVPITRCVYTPADTDTITVAEWYLN